MIFSVIIPTYNRPQMLLRAVNSVFNQVYRSFEIIIIDDNSDVKYDYDHPLYNHTSVKFLKNDITCGVAASRNLGIKEACGDVICFLDDDDEYTPSYLKDVHAAFLKHQTDFCCSSVQYIDYYDDQIVKSNRLFKSSYPSKIHFFEEIMSIGIGHGFAIKLKCIQEIGGLNPEYKTVEDTDFFIRLLSKEYAPLMLTSIGVTLHNHTSPRLTDSTMDKVRIQECQKLLTVHDKFFFAYPSLKNQLERHILFLRKRIDNFLLEKNTVGF